MNMTRTIRGTVYQLTIHIQDDGISMEDSILRMIANRPLPFLREPANRPLPFLREPLAPAPAAQLDKAIV